MRKKYETDLTDEQWDKRELVNAVLYLVKTGCQWRNLPHDFPPVFTVHSFYRRARLNGLWDKILEHPTQADDIGCLLAVTIHKALSRFFRLRSSQVFWLGSRNIQKTQAVRLANITKTLDSGAYFFLAQSLSAT